MARDLHQDEELESKPLDRELFRRLWVYVRPQWKSLAGVVVLLLFATGFDLYCTKLMADALDIYVYPLGHDAAFDKDAAVRGIWQTAALMTGLYLIQAILTYSQMNLLVSAGQRIVSDLRMKLFTHIQKLPALFFDTRPTGKLVTRLTNDVNNIHEAFSGVCVYLIKDLFLMIGILTVMFWVSPKLALVLLIPVPFLIAASLFFRILNRRAYRKVRESLSRFNSFMHETFAGISVIKVFGRERGQERRFGELNDENYRANLVSVTIGSVFIPLVGFLITLPTALLLWYGGLQVLDGFLTIGTIFLMISYLRMFYEPISDFSQKYILMQSAMASAERIFQLMDTPVSDAENAALTESGIPQIFFPEPFRGRIEFKKVSFAYDPRKKVLEDVSFVIEHGQTLALVGDTGSGKTTITSLLCRFYEADSGEILVDGVNIRTLPLAELRKHIAIVMQEPFIFSRTAAENIALGTPGLSRDKILEAARHIGADEFLSKLPQGYDTLLTERGSNLSAGQRQLLTFTRALAHNRSVIILDEATAAIDSATEQTVQRAIRTLLSNRTAIVVAHRLSTIRNAHRILVLRQGRIIESGNHETLVSQNGLYAEMVRKQLSATLPS